MTTIDGLDALQASVARLRALAEPLDGSQLRAPAYPSEWSIAETLSHIGSAAVIMGRRIDDALAGEDTDADFAPQVWDEWNAKSPEDQAADALAVDRVFLERLESIAEDAPADFGFSMGPMRVDLPTVVRMRVTEHALHTWDVEVALDPTATLPTAETGVAIDNLEMVARYSGKPTGVEQTLHIATAAPRRAFELQLGADSVSLSPASDDSEPDLELPAEAFVRLVYGRLDPAHTPPVDHGDVLAALRPVFTGV
jgi:uncharacterized protein (TIGR03083 family)